MKGIELSRRYFETCGKPVLEKEFKDILPFLAIGFVGSGSERYGYDDEISRDHDFEPGFCIFLPGEEVIDRRTEFLLERAYAKLPREFMGFSRQIVSPVGGNRNGVKRTADFYSEKVGSPTGELSIEQWLRIPEHYLAEATNGEVFSDGYGEFTRIRNSLLAMPDDIRKKKLAGNILLMAQTGQYNYKRCLAHREPESAQLALNSFADSAIKVFFLLHRRYLPFYKWVFRAIKELPEGAEFSEKIVRLFSGDPYDIKECDKKYAAVEYICSYIVTELLKQDLTKENADDLERQAYSVNSGIKDGQLRNANVFIAV